LCIVLMAGQTRNLMIKELPHKQPEVRPGAPDDRY
jgi:hypothetical protein